MCTRVCVCVCVGVCVPISLSHYLDLERKEERDLRNWLQFYSIIYSKGGNPEILLFPLGSSDLIKMYNYLPYLNESIIWEIVMGLGVASIAIQFSIAIEFSFAMEFSGWRIIIMFNKYIPFRDLMLKTQHPFSHPTKLLASTNFSELVLYGLYSLITLKENYKTVTKKLTRNCLPTDTYLEVLKQICK